MCDRCSPGFSQSGETARADCVQCLETGMVPRGRRQHYKPDRLLHPRCTASTQGASTATPATRLPGGECVECPHIALRFGPPLLLMLLAAVLLRKVLRSTAAALRHELEEKTGLDVSNAETVKNTARSGVGLIRQMAAMMSLLSFAQTSTTLVGMNLSWPTEVRVFADYVSPS